MQKSDFFFDLPPDLIARRPVENRTASRLLVVDRNQQRFWDAHFSDLPDYLDSGDLLVFNDTRVINARLHGRKQSGGQIEVLVERVEDPRNALVQIRASRSPKPGGAIEIAGRQLTVTHREDRLFGLQLDVGPDWYAFLEQHGEVPLPPYIDRAADDDDLDRYQTVYASKPGAVAAPTAGLHFDQPLLDQLKNQNIQSAFVTLHVGLGTFQPVQVDNVKEHKMHSEQIDVPESTCAQITATRNAGQRVVAVGTTSLRSLESAYKDGSVRPFQGETDIFIYPGKTVHSIDALITNFHLPESTLLMLISALAGTELIQQAYQHAIRERYRFFSYGDAMLIL